MGFHAVKMARRTTGGPGIKASCTHHEDPAARVVTISFNREAQNRHFGREINAETDKFVVERGTDTDKGKLRIQLTQAGEVDAGKSMHGSIRFKLQAFPPIPSEHVKSADCHIVNSDPKSKAVIVRVPWRDGSLK